MMKRRLVVTGLVALAVLVTSNALFPTSGQQAVTVPSHPMTFGAFTSRFDADGSFLLEGQGWPTMKGTWKLEGAQIQIVVRDAPDGCGGPGLYRPRVDGSRFSLDLVSDDCRPRKMILDGSTWVPAGTAKTIATRQFVRTAGSRPQSKPEPQSAEGSWPSFRGTTASGVAEKQNLPDQWSGKSGENILWKSPIPGLAHSSPVVWGSRIFVTSAISSRPNATFKPGLYGDGDASDDRTSQKWTIFALDKKSGKILWQRVAHEGVPREKRHIKSTYASASPATDGRIVVAWFGSQGVHAYDVNGNFLWKVDIGRVDMGAYDIPTYEWGPASSPIIWNGLVILQCDTQTDSFLLALNADTGETVWKSEREELPSWGTPTVAMTPAGAELVTNAPNFVRGYDPRTGKELWRIGHSSKITAPTPIFSGEFFVIASGRAPERPIFVVKPGARGDLTLPSGVTSNEGVVWSKTGRGSYMPTPLVYKGILYVLANNGVFDAYDVATGREIYRERLMQVGSGFSASPVAADDKIYLSNEDGEMLVIAAGPQFKELGWNSMGELLMATPALSDGVMYVRSSESLFAVGKKK
jgi:outer membrane protein assembly factor BamB